MIKDAKKSFAMLSGIFTLSLLLVYPSWAATYEIDKAHSSMGFAVKHLMVSTVRGGFTDFAGSVMFDPNDLGSFNAEATIQADSVNTQQAERDKHLKSADFFDTATYPTITFKSSKLEKTESGYNLMGDLTIRGTTKAVSIPITISGPVKGPGGDVIGMEGSLEINRQDYGVSWNKVIDNGVIVSDTVKIDVDIEAHK